MIDFVQTPHGLMPKPLADRIEKQADDQRREQKATHDARMLAVRDRVARSLGVNTATLPIPTAETIERAAATAKAKFSKLALAQAYPCRGCVKAWDDRYKAKCAKRGKIPCFVSAAFKGCDQFKDRPVTA